MPQEQIQVAEITSEQAAVGASAGLSPAAHLEDRSACIVDQIPHPHFVVVACAEKLEPVRVRVELADKNYIPVAAEHVRAVALQTGESSQ